MTFELTRALISLMAAADLRGYAIEANLYGLKGTQRVLLVTDLDYRYNWKAGVSSVFTLI